MAAGGKIHRQAFRTPFLPGRRINCSTVVVGAYAVPLQGRLPRFMRRLRGRFELGVLPLCRAAPRRALGRFEEMEALIRRNRRPLGPQPGGFKRWLIRNAGILAPAGTNAAPIGSFIRSPYPCVRNARAASSRIGCVPPAVITRARKSSVSMWCRTQAIPFWP